MLGANAVERGQCRRRVGHRPLVDRNTLTRHRCLVDAGRPDHHHAIGRQSFIGAHNHDVGHLQCGDGDFLGSGGAAHGGCLRRQLGQGFDRLAGAAHRVVLQRMSQTEQEQQQGAFGPLAKRRSADGGHQHQRVDLEAPCAKVVERLANRVVAAE